MSATYDKILFYVSMALLNIGVLGAVGFAHVLPAALPAPVVIATAPSAPPPVRESPVPEKSQPAAKSGTPVRVVVPARGVDLFVRPGNYDPASGTWTLSHDSAYYATPTVPANDAAGTTLIYGHNVPYIFENLHQLTPGEELLVYTDTGFLFRYRFERAQEVTPEATDLFTNDGPPTVILQTCSGLWSEYRKLFLFELAGVEKI